MNREVKIGILALVAILGSVWGYSFLKGKNLLTNSYTFYAKFENVDQLPISAPVLVSGYQIGSVTNIKLDPSDMKTVVVTMDVENEFDVPSNTVVRLISTGLMGQKAIELVINGPCNGANCAKSGDYLQSEVQTMIQSMIGENTLDEALKGLGTGLSSAFDSIDQRLSSPENDGRITRILRNIDLLTASLIQTSEQLNVMINTTNRNLGNLTNNMNGVVSNLNSNNEAIEAILKNAADITGELEESDLKGAVTNLNQTMQSADGALQSFDNAIVELQTTIDNLNGITANIKNGDGSMGKLVRDPELYDNLNKMSKNLDLLLQDFRLNPKRYVNVSVFGKKQKEYELPEDDPAYLEE